MSDDLEAFRAAVVERIRNATDTELDDCIEDEDACFDAKIHMASMSLGVVRTVYATPEQIATEAVAALEPAIAAAEQRGYDKAIAKLRARAVQEHDEHSPTAMWAVYLAGADYLEAVKDQP